MKKLLVILLSVLLLFGVFATTASAAGISFTDVKTSDWFYDDVKNAVNMGLVNGKSATIYAPDDNLTYAEAVKLAACMHERYTTGSVTQTNSPTGKWYDSYVAYAKSNGIVSSNFNWDATATRAGYMSIFAHALPDSALQAINNVPDDSIPDVKYNGYYYGPDIYKLYRAGVVQGVDAQFNCNPGSNIKRSEVAAILTRMMDPAARKTFSTVPAAALTIVTQPQSVTIVEGGDAKFTVAVSGGTPPYKYEWHRIVASNGNYNVILDADEALITGTQTGALTTKQCKAYENGDQYYCVVSDASGGFIVSQKATLTVGAGALTVTKQPKNKTIDEGGDANFTVEASGGTQPYTYEWHRVIKVSNYDLKITQDEPLITGTKTPSLTTKNCQSDENGDQYYCVIRDANGNSVTSSRATLTVNSAALTITKQPANTSTTEKGSAKFSVTASGGTAPYSYTWHRIPKGSTDDFTLQNNSVFPGADTANLTVNNCQLSETGDRYYCVVTDATGKSVESSKATLTVKSAGLSVSISPTSKTVSVDGEATFAVSVSGGSGSYSYEWHRIVKSNNDYDAKLTVDTDNLYGVKTKSLTTSECRLVESGDKYYCVVTDNSTGKTAESPKATLTVK